MIWLPFLLLVMEQPLGSPKFTYERKIFGFQELRHQGLLNPIDTVLSGKGDFLWHEPPVKTTDSSSVFSLADSSIAAKSFEVKFDGKRIVVGQLGSLSSVMNRGMQTYLLSGHMWDFRWTVSPAPTRITYYTRGVWSGLELGQWLPDSIIFEFNWNTPDEITEVTWTMPPNIKSSPPLTMRSMQTVKSGMYVAHLTYRKGKKNEISIFRLFFDKNKMVDLWQDDTITEYRFSVASWPHLSRYPYILTVNRQKDVLVRQLMNNRVSLVSSTRYANKEWEVVRASPFREYVVVHLQPVGSYYSKQTRLLFCDARTMRVRGEIANEVVGGWTHDGSRMLVVPTDKNKPARIVSGPVTFSR